MRKIRTQICVSILLLFGFVALAFAASVHHIRVDGVINPVSSQFMMDAVDRAAKENADLLVIELDTPGGLLEATRDIVKSFLASEVPIAVYVSPSGARAGSAGVFITLAAHIAAMAPGTNIGAAHPVTIGGGGMPGSGQKDTTGSSVMGAKMTNDAAAMIRAIAEERGRNIEWAESAVRESESITATDAVELDVIDLIASSLDNLLSEIDGKTVTLPSGEHVIHSQPATIYAFEMTWRERLLNRLTDPNIAYIFMLLGIYGLIYELANPGAVLPGVIGGICILLAFFAFQTLPISLVGLSLIVFGIILLLLEIKVPSYGVLTIGGASSLLLGSLMLIDTTVPALKVSLTVIVPSVVATVLFALFAVGLGLKAQTRKVTTGSEGLLDQIGEALEDLNPNGQIMVNGEYWRAKSQRLVEKGNLVRVLKIERMILIVEPVSRDSFKA